MLLTLQKGEIVHQVLHSLGMWHEHQRPDRDTYIEIMSDNFEANEAGDFRAIPVELIDTANLPYDYTSLMHFHAKVSIIFVAYVVTSPTALTVCSTYLEAAM